MGWGWVCAVLGVLSMAAGVKLLGAELVRRTAGTQSGPGPAMPYRLAKFLSNAERSFYGVLAGAMPSGYVVCPKVRLADVITGPKAGGWQNRINQKHLDFVVCEAASMRPVCAVELDDSSHSRTERRERDEFLEAACEAAGLVLLRVRCQAAYEMAAVRRMVESALVESQTRKGG